MPLGRTRRQHVQINMYLVRETVPKTTPPAIPKQWSCESYSMALCRVKSPDQIHNATDWTPETCWSSPESCLRSPFAQSLQDTPGRKILTAGWLWYRYESLPAHRVHPLLNSNCRSWLINLAYAFVYVIENLSYHGGHVGTKRMRTRPKLNSQDPDCLLFRDSSKEMRCAAQ